MSKSQFNYILIICLWGMLFGDILFTIGYFTEDEQISRESDMVEYRFISVDPFVIYTPEIINFPAGYNVSKKTFQIGTKVDIYCGIYSQVYEADGSPKQGLTPNISFIATPSHEEPVFCYEDNCLLRGVNSQVVNC